MPTYLLRRLLMGVVVLLLVTTFMGALARLIPGDPVKLILGPRADAALSARVREEMGLDQPLLTQTALFVLNAARGDLGEDFVSSLPVTLLIGSVLPHTLALALSGLGLAVVIGVPLGVFAATHPNSWADRLLAVLSISLITLPTYVIGLLLLLVFAVQLNWLPAIGAGENAADYLQHLILPAVTLSLTWIGYLARLVRASLLEVLNQPYIRTAFAYGIPQARVFYKLALRNALIPTVAVLGVGLGNLLGGAIFVEVIFTRPGLGRLIFEAIADRNYPIVRGGVVVAAALFVLANIVADLSYQYLDPRLRGHEATKP